MGEEGAGFAGVPGDVGGEEDALGVLGLQVGMVERNGLLLVDVDADAGDAAFVDGADEVRLDGDAAAAGVDQIGRGLHLAKAGVVNEPGGAVVVGGVDADDIGLGQEVVEGDGGVVLAVVGAGGGVVYDLHAEGLADGGDFLADGAHAHDTEGLAAELRERMVGIDMDAAGAVAAVLRVGVVVERAAGEGENVHPGRLRDRFRGISRDIPDDDPAGVAQLYIDIVDARPGLAHEFEFRARVQEGLVHNDLVQQHDIGIRRAGTGLFGRGGRVADEFAQGGDLVHRSVAHRGGIQENDLHDISGYRYKYRIFLYL